MITIVKAIRLIKVFEYLTQIGTKTGVGARDVDVQKRRAAEIGQHGSHANPTQRQFADTGAMSQPCDAEQGVDPGGSNRQPNHEFAPGQQRLQQETTTGT